MAHQEDSSQSRSKVNQGRQELEARKEVSLPHSGHSVANQTILALALLEEGKVVGRLSQVASALSLPPQSCRATGKGDGEVRGNRSETEN